MLQQTQVERVILFYKNFIKKFPTAHALARAPLQEVLLGWQGLGYNRRAKLLREAAQNLVTTASFSTRSNLVKELEALPGVGPYTARAVAAFAFNQNTVFIETNIRTAVIHHFFSDKNTSIYGSISDADITKVLQRASPKGRAREWYSALMDYGAYLKRSGVRLNTKSKHYSKQSKFEGSPRQVRGAILKALTTGVLLASVKKEFPDRFATALSGLERDGLIKKKGRGWTIA